jgi:hypothetical protein
MGCCCSHPTIGDPEAGERQLRGSRANSRVSGGFAGPYGYENWPSSNGNSIYAGGDSATGFLAITRGTVAGDPKNMRK